MNSNKLPLTEVANNAEALQQARSAPIQQGHPRRSMDFIRSLILDIPLQQEKQVEITPITAEQVIENQTENVPVESLESIRKLAGLK